MKRARIPTLDMTPYRFEDGTVSRYASPGYYPIFYVTADYGVLCAACVEAEAEVIAEADATDDDQWRLIAAEANWEDPRLYCDHCGERIESAYAEPDESETETEAVE